MASNWDNDELDEGSGKCALNVKDSWDDEDELQSLTSCKESGNATSTSVSSGRSGSSRVGKDSSVVSSKKEKQQPTTTRSQKATEDRSKDVTLKSSQESRVSDPLERKLELERLVKEADIENTKDLFVGKGVSSLNISPSCVASIDSMKPSNGAEFEEFRHTLLENLKGLKNQPDYLNFLLNFVRDLASDLHIEDIKELAKVLTVISNEKLRAEKDSKTKKKPAALKKVTLKAESGLDYTNYGDVADDFDDFM